MRDKGERRESYNEISQFFPHSDNGKRGMEEWGIPLNSRDAIVRGCEERE